ncbi:unnamed protein product [Rotaria sordida]|uniref:Uncharacterized protein n=1 Tax=Rotaria sordida TaxID=392033 RepID=A0A819GCX3_9BILA|nr:unnamed protein product [Rotaria sordida]CAF3755055.1 unnamed protein product [Rotaria sordida]CAF3880948.1 unnamed protein product [Rotaria sordida]
MIAAAIESSDDDISNDSMDVFTSHSSLTTDPSLHALYQIDDPSSQQPNNTADFSSSYEDDDDDLNELCRTSDINYQRKLYTGTFLSLHDACQITIKLARRLNLDKKKTNILLKGIHALLPQDNKLPKTTVGLMKILAHPIFDLGINNDKKVIYYCAECLTCLETPQQTTCSPNCPLNNNYRPFSNASELTINDVKCEIRSTIARYANVINDYRNRSKVLLPCDVPNANVYQTISSTTAIKSNQNQVTVMLHTDGAPVTKIKGKSLWPIQATLCEIPPPLRDHKQAIMIFGAWLGIHHPDRNLLWKNVVNQIQQLFKDEIIVTINKQQLKYIVRIQLITFDLPALASNCNIVQYNGYNACPYCQMTGKAVDKQVMYPHSPIPCPPKTTDDYRRYGTLNSSSTITMGIKGPSPLTDILLFPIQVAIDYMHLTCSGHVKTLIGYWHKMLLPKVFEEASVYLSSIILPHNFNHQFMPLVDYQNWKTKLFRILFLPDRYALHFLYYFIYVRTLYHYETISELDNIDLLFDEYYKNLSKLYGEKSELLTVHLHSHLKEQVLHHGALSMTSCFPRESYLGLAVTMCYGKKYVLAQYISWHLIDRSLCDKNTIEVNDVFITERFYDRHLDIQMIARYKAKLIECLKRQKIIFDESLQIQYYARYRRGLKSYHSKVYSRAGRAISHRVSVANSKCTHARKRCFANVIFYFKLSNVYYAFIKKYPCINLSLGSGLTTAAIPQNILERLDLYYGTKAQMHLDKTKYARQTGSEEIDLGNFVDSEDEKENQEQDLDMPTSLVQTLSTPQGSTASKENSNNKLSQSYSSSRSSIIHTTNDKPLINFDTVFNSPSTSKKRPHDSESSLDVSENDDDDEEPRNVIKKQAKHNDSSDMLNRLLNRKKAPARKRKKLASTVIDSTDVECKGCRDLCDVINKLTKRVERVERVVPAVKQFFRQKSTGAESSSTTAPLSNIEQINLSIKEIFDVEPNQVKGPRDRPTIIIRHLFTISNHVSDYRQYLEKHSNLLKAFLQYRCPGILNMDDTWLEINKSMASLANDIKKNTKTKLARQMANSSTSQQQPIATIPSNDMSTTPDDDLKQNLTF